MRRNGASGDEGSGGLNGRTSDESGATGVREMPPLSSALRDSPRRRPIPSDPPRMRGGAGRGNEAAAYSFGVRPGALPGPPLSRAPFRPQSFCLRVSGAVAPSAPRLRFSPGRGLSCGRAYGRPSCTTAPAPKPAPRQRAQAETNSKSELGNIRREEILVRAGASGLLLRTAAADASQSSGVY